MNWDLDYTRIYRKFHDDSAEHQRWLIDFNRRLLERHLPELKAAPALDIGCGMGFALLYLREAGFEHVEGIDIDAGQVRSCVQKGLSVQQVEDTVGFVSRRENHYGLVLAMDVLEHIPRNEQMPLLRAVHRTLLAGGRFICSVPNANSTLASRWRYLDFTHHSSFTEYSLDFALYNAGFRQIEVAGYEFMVHPSRNGAKPQSFRRFDHYLKYQTKAYLNWWLLRVVRGWRRLEMMGELGWEQGMQVPLSLNLLGVAVKD